ncbi:hypothetical protein BDF19DRAFT_467799 [Syncephalis fuscata]|nr:hypothetical protein BDF19DRAFT_467799 [Syncephalis fuscata]
MSSTTHTSLGKLYVRVAYSAIARGIRVERNTLLHGCAVRSFTKYSCTAHTARTTRLLHRALILPRLQRQALTTLTTDTLLTNENKEVEEEEEEEDLPPLGQCPGCGIQLQQEDPFLPGYLPDTLAKSTTQLASLSEERKGRRTQKSTHRSLGDEDFDRLVAELPEELRKEFVPTASNLEVETTNTTESTDHAVIDEELSDKPTHIDENIDENIDEITKEALAETTQLPTRICQRCHTLRYQHCLPSTQTELWGSTAPALTSEAIDILHRRRGVMPILVIDIFDFPGSIPPALVDIVTQCKQLLVVVNKMDILPEKTRHKRIKQYVTEELNRMGIKKISDVVPVSAHTGVGIHQLVKRIQKLRTGDEDLYLIGSVNAGKSALINAFLRYSRAYRSAQRTKELTLTTSPIPGTTMAGLGISCEDLGRIFDPAALAPQNRGRSRERMLYDMPGIIAPDQLINFLEPQELSHVLPRHRIKPLTYRILPGESVLLGGLARLDYTEGSRPMLMTLTSALRPHFTNIKRADELIAQLAKPDSKWPGALSPPKAGIMRLKPYPPLKSALNVSAYGQHDTMASLDIVWSGIGWIALAGRFPPVTLHTWSPNGVGVYTRPALLPYEFTGKVAKRSQSLRKTPA